MQVITENTDLSMRNRRIDLLKKISFDDLKLNVKFTIIIVTLLSLSIGIFSSIFFDSMKDTMIKENEEYTTYTLQRSVDNLEDTIASVNMVTQLFSTDTEMYSILSRVYEHDEITGNEWINLKRTTIASLERLVNANPVINGVRVYSSDDSIQEVMPILYKNVRIQEQDWYQNDEHQGWMLDYEDHLFQSYALDKDSRIASYVSDVRNTQGDTIGVIETTIQMDDMFPSLYENNDDEWGCFISANGDYITGEQNQEKLSVLSGITEDDSDSSVKTSYIQNRGGYHMVASVYISELNGYLVFVKNMSPALANINRIQIFYVLGFIILIVLLAFAIDKIVNRLLRQLNEILKVINLVQDGDMQVRIPKLSNDEMGNLSNQLNQMLDRIVALMKENLNRELLAKNSQIRALQNQINAHFIYNVLDSINMMAELDEEFEIADAVTSLGTMLHYSMSWNNGMVSVENELEYIQDYVKLANLRRDYEVSLDIDMPSALMQQYIPKMSLQPIIENAIKYGLPDEKEGNIEIIGEQKGDKTVIEVIDHGIGMSDEQVAKIRKQIAGEIQPDHTSEKPSQGKKGHGIGLKNVQDRIAIAYGDAYGLSLESKEAEYTKVTMTIPADTVSENTERFVLEQG